MISVDLAVGVASSVVLRFPYDPVTVDKVRTIPGRRWAPKLLGWVVPITEIDKVKEMGGVLSVNLKSRLESMKQEAEVGLALKSGEGVDISDFTFPSTQPLKHQRVGCSLLKNRSKFAFFWEMRSGKTFLALAGIKQNPMMSPTLVIAPASVLHVWEDQAAKHQPDLKVLALTGTIKARAERMLSEKADAYVINPESIWRPEMFAAIEQKNWSMLIVDESHRFKTRNSQQTKALLKLTKHFPRRYIMTGSPHDNNPMELWSQMAILDTGILGTSFMAYRERYAVMGGFEGKQIVKYKNLDELKKRMEGHSHYVRTSDVWDLPPRLDEVRKLEMVGKQAKAYKEMSQELLTEIEGGTIMASVLVAKLIKLRQILAGFAYDSEGAVHRLENNVKLEALEDLIDELPKDQKMVVWCAFGAEMDIVCEMLTQRGIAHCRIDGSTPIAKRGGVIEQFNNNANYKVFVGQQQAGGLGIDLSAASHCVFMTNEMDRSVRLQAEARIVGPNQKSKTVSYYDFVVSSSWDVTALRKLKNKETLSNTLTASEVRFMLDGDA